MELVLPTVVAWVVTESLNTVARKLCRLRDGNPIVTIEVIYSGDLGEQLSTGPPDKLREFQEQLVALCKRTTHATAKFSAENVNINPDPDAHPTATVGNVAVMFPFNASSLEIQGVQTEVAQFFDIDTGQVRITGVRSGNSIHIGLQVPELPAILLCTEREQGSYRSNTILGELGTQFGLRLGSPGNPRRDSSRTLEQVRNLRAA